MTRRVVPDQVAMHVPHQHYPGPDGPCFRVDCHAQGGRPCRYCGGGLCRVYTVDPDRPVSTEEQSDWRGMVTHWTAWAAVLWWLVWWINSDSPFVLFAVLGFTLAWGLSLLAGAGRTVDRMIGEAGDDDDPR